ncbi:hypothetical protein T484DRAFT_1847642, partial [Baffinella frigidus]
MFTAVLSNKIGLYGTTEAGTCASGSGAPFGNFVVGMLDPFRMDSNNGNNNTTVAFIEYLFIVYEGNEIAFLPSDMVHDYYWPIMSYGDKKLCPVMIGTVCSQLLGYVTCGFDDSPAMSLKDFIRPQLLQVMMKFGSNGADTTIYATTHSRRTIGMDAEQYLNKLVFDIYEIATSSGALVFNPQIHSCNYYRDITARGLVDTLHPDAADFKDDVLTAKDGPDGLISEEEQLQIAEFHVRDTLSVDEPGDKCPNTRPRQGEPATSKNDTPVVVALAAAWSVRIEQCAIEAAAALQPAAVAAAAKAAAAAAAVEAARKHVTFGDGGSASGTKKRKSASTSESGAAGSSAKTSRQKAAVAEQHSGEGEGGSAA